MEKVTRTKDAHATRGRRSVVAFGVAALLVAAGCSSQSSSTSTTAAVTTTTSATTVRIGLEGPLTGSQSSVGIGMLDAARLAATNLNASGGILGKKVVIVPIDDKADPATGVAAATRAIASGLTGVVGPYNSGVGIKTLPLYLKAGLVPIRLTSANSTEGLGVTLQPMT
ncbi:MAG: ABC transporter substrate-binding protein, partial [Actinomycetes bacterium]